MVGHIFVSYGKGLATAYVANLVAHLRALGLPTSFDGDVDHGQPWAKTIRASIDACTAFVPVMSPEAEDSHWVAEETEYARNKGKPILPLLLEGEAYFGFRTTQYEDVRHGDMPGIEFIRALRELTTKN